MDQCLSNFKEHVIEITLPDDFDAVVYECSIDPGIIAYTAKAGPDIIIIHKNKKLIINEILYNMESYIRFYLLSDNKCFLCDKIENIKYGACINCRMIICPDCNKNILNSNIDICGQCEMEYRGYLINI